MSAAGSVPLRSTVTLLVVSGDDQDHASLQHILEGDCQLHRASGRQDAALLAQQYRPSVVICEETLLDGDWRDLLADLQGEPGAPRLVVYSKWADHGLWADVLSLGGYDVLLKPFNKLEVRRIVGLAAGDRRTQ